MGSFAVLFILDVLTHLLDKVATNLSGDAAGHEWQFYSSLIKQPIMWLATTLMPFQLLVWTKILERTDLSVANAISSLSFPLTMIASSLFLHEVISTQAWFGSLLITVGVAMVGIQPPDDSETAVPAPDAVLLGRK